MSVAKNRLSKYNDLKITDMFHSLIYNYSYYKMGIENGLRINQLTSDVYGGNSDDSSTAFANKKPSRQDRG